MNDSRCDEIANFFEEDSSNFLRISSIFTLIVGVLLITLSYAYFIKYQGRYERLRNRNTFLITLSGLSALMLTFNYSVRNIVGSKNFSCRLYRLLGLIQTSTLLVACFCRAFSLIWRVEFNYKLIEKSHAAMLNGELVLSAGAVRFIGLPSGSKRRGFYDEVFHGEREGVPVPTLPQESISVKNQLISRCLFTMCYWTPQKNLPTDLQLSRFLATKYFASALCLCVLVSLSALSVTIAFLEFPLGEDCFGCLISPDNSISEKLFVSVFFTAGILGLFVLYKFWKLPESLGIRKELVFYSVLLIISVIIVFPIGVTSREVLTKGRFDFIFVTVIQLFISVLYMMPYQVYLARKGVDDEVDPDSKLTEILASEKGTKAFTLYLASALSLETLYFYKAACEWKSMFQGGSNESLAAAAAEIYSTYIDKDAFLLIDISATCREELEARLGEDELPETLFDTAVMEVYEVMSNDLFVKFKKTSYYKAFANELHGIE